MLIVYGIPNCDTIKKTINYLIINEIEFVFHDYKKEGISLEKLLDWTAQHPWEILLNRAGTTYKALSDAQKESIKDAQSAAALMTEMTSLIKRPVIEKEGKIIKIGWKPAEI